MSRTYDVEVVRLVDAPVERVWAAWTTPEDLRRWWGPQGFTCPRADVDLRVGGRIAVTMRAPQGWGGFEQHSTWTITEAAPPTVLRYVFRFVDADGGPLTPAQAGIPMAGVPDAGAHEVLLRDLGDGRTELRMTERGYTAEAARDVSRTGLEQCLDKLCAVVARDPAAADARG